MIEAAASPHDGRVARLQLRGVATGYETIRLATGHGAATPFFVAAQTVTVDSLFVGALSPAFTELRLAPAGALPPGSSFEVEYGLRQLLLAEGSEARLFGVAVPNCRTAGAVFQEQFGGDFADTIAHEGGEGEESGDGGGGDGARERRGGIRTVTKTPLPLPESPTLFADLRKFVQKNIIGGENALSTLHAVFRVLLHAHCSEFAGPAAAAGAGAGGGGAEAAAAPETMRERWEKRGGGMVDREVAGAEDSAKLDGLGDFERVLFLGAALGAERGEGRGFASATHPGRRVPQFGITPGLGCGRKQG